MYTVKDVAKLLDLTEHTVRFYTDKGLVPSLQRDKIIIVCLMTSPYTGLQVQKD